jgi:Zn-finger nucleic acid-binding protein
MKVAGANCSSLRSCLFACALLVGLVPPAAAKPVDGEWQLSITGTSLFFYGTRMLTAGLQQDWEVMITFQVSNQQFDVGSGKARLIGKARPYSNPEKMFQCQSIEGVYLDRGLHEVTTPHIRYEGFPVAGQIAAGQVSLQPDVQYIGNFIAMMYECQTDDIMGDVWLERGRLSSIERAKRQDAKQTRDTDHYQVRIKELQFMDPRGKIEIPLVDGLRIRQQDQASFAEKTYSLKYVPTE